MKRLFHSILLIGLWLPQILISQPTSISDSAKVAVAARIQLINEKIREKGYRWQAGVTSLSYLNESEMARLCGLKIDTSNSRTRVQNEQKMFDQYKASKENRLSKTQTVPNWTSWMGRVKNQNGCGNCWAHAAAGVAIGLLHKYHGSNIGIDFDEYDISENATCAMGCDGTYNPSCGLSYILSNKVRCEQGMNQFPNFDFAYYTVSSIEADDAPSIASIKASLENSPVDAAFDVYSDFYSYTSGIYQHVYGGKVLGGHEVVIVSYDDANSCWICKNSWGTNWGERASGQPVFSDQDANARGYFRIAYGQCGIDNTANVTATVASDSCFAKIIPDLQTFPSAMSYRFVNNEGAYVLSSVSINSGSTVNIPSDSKILFANGTSLTSYGVLNVNGTSTSRPTFTSASSTSPNSWGSIYLSGSGAASSSLSYCTMQYGYAMVCDNGANATIDHCTINNNSYGILVYSSSPTISNDTISYPSVHGIQLNGSTSNPWIHDNKIVKNNINSGAGVYVYGSSCMASSNTISGFNVGLYVRYNSVLGGWTTDYWTTPSRNNYLHDNLYGVYTYDNGSASLGSFGSGSYHGHNNWIENNSGYDLLIGTSTVLYAYQDWFGGDFAPTYAQSWPCNFNWSPLGTNPWNGSLRAIDHNIQSPISLKIVADNSNVHTGEVIYNQESGNNNGEDTLYSAAFSHQMERSYSTARDEYAQLLSSKKYSKNAQIMLNYLYRDSKDESVVALFEGQLSNVKSRTIDNANLPLLTNLLANMYCMKKNYVKGLALYGDVIKAYPNTMEERNARIEKIYYTVEGATDVASVDQQLDELLTNDDGGDDVEMIKEFVNHKRSLSELPSTQSPNEPKENIADTSHIPTTVSLLPNYPNPFNPTTQINFQLPASAQVSLKVYDMLGRLVATLVDGMNAAGYHSVSFDGSQLSSGVYLTRFIVKPQNGSKPIVQTRKVLLMK